MSHLRAWRRSSIVVAAAGVVLLGLAACAPASEPGGTPSTAPETPEPYDGPVAFVGDELDLLVLEPEEIAEILPGATGVTASSSVLMQVSDGSGPSADPRICEVFYTEHALHAVGARVVTWSMPGAAQDVPGVLQVLQFADEEHARSLMDQVVQGAEQCSAFTKEAAVTFDGVATEGEGEVRALAGTLTDSWSGTAMRTVRGYAATGNVVTVLEAPLPDGTEVDNGDIAEAMNARTEDARDALIEKLTATPPTEEEAPTGDASAPWSEWKISTAGVGPILLGDTLDSAKSVFPDGSVAEPEFPGGEWKATAPGADGSILIEASGDGSKVAALTVGTGASLERPLQEGQALPAAGEIRVGSPVAEAISAFPGGTIVTVASSGDDWYDVATRSGRLLRFHTDRDAVDPEALIVGITARDATMTPLPQLGD